LTDCVVVAGTRPEIIKVSRMFESLQRRELSFSFLFISQHSDYEMSRLFLDELGLSSLAEVIPVAASEGPITTMANMMKALEDRIESVRPSVMLVQGDTNATLAATLVGVKNGIPVAHIEAGLRSHDLRMPEEYNRRMVDHAALALFAPTTLAAENLYREAVTGRVVVTGNTVIDAVEHYIRHAAAATRGESPADESVGEYGKGGYLLATFHRAENVDDPLFLVGLLEVCSWSPLPIVLPLHPRSRRRLSENGLLDRFLSCPNLRVLPPVGYFEFLKLMSGSKLILTDSGGVQEEATAPSIRKRTIVVRLSTERPEAQAAGYAIVAGTSPERIMSELTKALALPPVDAPCPFGDGNASDRIASEVEAMLAEQRKPIAAVRGAY
jgi:UDP-N-acetylglucosamine 2-epimerase (non-hydrolysing)